MPTYVCQSIFISVCLLIYFKIWLILELPKLKVIPYISAILKFIMEMTLSEILSEETVIKYGYDNCGQCTVLIYVVVNKLYMY